MSAKRCSHVLDNGKQCRLPGIYLFDDSRYCGLHYPPKLIEKEDRKRKRQERRQAEREALVELPRVLQAKLSACEREIQRLQAHRRLVDSIVGTNFIHNYKAMRDLLKKHKIPFEEEMP